MEGFVEVKDKRMKSRLLYSNPVVLLVSASDADVKNVMVLSWLTPVNNRGVFVFSINKKRHSLKNLKQTRRFCLAVPVEGMEQILIDIGSCTGGDTVSNLAYCAEL